MGSDVDLQWHLVLSAQGVYPGGEGSRCRYVIHTTRRKSHEDKVEEHGPVRATQNLVKDYVSDLSTRGEQIHLPGLVLRILSSLTCSI